ncbi:MAG: hypothetical protein R3348_08235, partial [Xanthomonadales bacterium]|nr:hypothetical protein [Xanthomonadales bacterium]
MNYSFTYLCLGALFLILVPLLPALSGAIGRALASGAKPHTVRNVQCFALAASFALISADWPSLEAPALFEVPGLLGGIASVAMMLSAWLLILPATALRPSKRWRHAPFVGLLGVAGGHLLVSTSLRSLLFFGAACISIVLAWCARRSHRVRLPRQARSLDKPVGYALWFFSGLALLITVVLIHGYFFGGHALRYVEDVAA